MASYIMKSFNVSSFICTLDKFILLYQQQEMLEKLQYCQLCPQSSVMYIHAILLLIQPNVITTDILKVLPDHVPAVENSCLSPKNLQIMIRFSFFFSYSQPINDYKATAQAFDYLYFYFNKKLLTIGDISFT